MKRGSVYLNSDLLKLLREEHCWSQVELSRICLDKGLCVSLSSIKRAETGKKVLYRTALGLATVFQVPVTQLKKHKVRSDLLCKIQSEGNSNSEAML